jgi:hypothetical protein
MFTFIYGLVCTFELRIPHRRLCYFHGILIASCFEPFMCFPCSCRLNLMKYIVPPNQLSENWRLHITLMCVCPCIVIIWEEENQLDATHCFIALVICSTCFGDFYAPHQELTTVLLIRHVACNSWLLLVRRSGEGQQAMHPG